MSDARWRDVERLCLAALELDEAARAAFLDAACAGDATLRHDVESLLARQSREAAFLERPPAGALVPGALGRAGDAFRPREPLPSGTRLGPYELGTLIGAGGMGEVYRARDTRLGRTVAVKVLPEAFAADADRRRRFHDEARAASALIHPHVCALFDVGEEAGINFLVMEYVEGETLDRVIARGPLPPERLLDTAIQIADAVAAAHDHGIVHRDLKPGNVIVGPAGLVKLLDFGLARLKAPASEEAGPASRAGEALSVPGHILGTVSYMSPEQAEGRRVDHRSDIFSTGIILYEMATGRRPFAGDSAGSVIVSIVRDTPPEPRALNPALPDALSAAIARCLVKDPSGRWPAAADLRQALVAIQREPAAQGTAPGRPVPAWRAHVGKPWMWAATAVLAAAAVTLTYLSLRPADQADAAARVRFTRLTGQPGMESFPSLSPDGDWVAYSAGPAWNTDVFIQRVGSDTPVNLTQNSAVPDTNPVFSPDGRRLAFRSERQGGGIFVMDLEGRSVRQVTDVGFSPAWAPDGSEIAFTRETPSATAPYSRFGLSTLWTVNLASGARRQVTLSDAMQPHWSPHGHRIAYWRSQHSQSKYRDIATVPAAGGTPVAVTDDAAVDWNPVWSPDGRFLYFASDRAGNMNIWRIGIDERTGAVRGTPEPLTTPAAFAAYPSFSADGRRLAFASVAHQSQAVRAPFDAEAARLRGAPQAITAGSQYWLSQHLSPDGAALAMTTFFGVEDVFVAAADGTAPRRLTDDAHSDRFARWAPDGRTIAFTSNRSGHYEIWAMQPDGTGLRQLTDRRSTAVDAVWAPDGTRMVFIDSATASTVVFDPRRPWHEQSPELLPPIGRGGGAFAATSWSPDGRRVAGFESASAEGPRPGVVLYDVASRTYERLTDVGGRPWWLGDSRRLVYHTGDSRLMVIDSQSRQTRELLAGSGPGEGFVDASVSGDGRWLYCLRRVLESDVWLATLPEDRAPGARR